MVNEFIYENFYEIYAYSIPYIVIYFTYGKIIRYRIRGKKFLQRHNSPFKIRLKQKYYTTNLGKYNLRMHLIWEKFRREKLANAPFYMIFNSRNRIISESIYFAFYGASFAFVLSEFYYFFQRKTLISKEHPRNYPLGIDSSNQFLLSSKDQTFSLTALQRETAEKIDAENNSAFDFIQLGKTFSDAFQDEISFQLYYLAYLKDRKIIGTNSELKLE